MHGGVADPRKSHLPQVYEPKRIELDTLLDRNLEVEHQDMDEFGKIGVKSLSYNQSQIHSDYDSEESIVDSDLEDGQLREMLAFTAVYTGCEMKTLILVENPQLQGNLMRWLYRKEKQVHNELKLMPQDESA